MKNKKNKELPINSKFLQVKDTFCIILGYNEMTKYKKKKKERNNFQ